MNGKQLGSVTVAVLAASLLLQQSAQPSDRSMQSLRHSCPDKSYVRISARMPEHDSFPNVELRLTDGHKRSAGYGPVTAPIPHSSYRRIIEIADAPQRSKAVAVEICDASPGSYELLVHEHGREFYVLTLSGSAASGSLLQPLNRFAQGDRTCLYRFTFEIAANSVHIDWTDELGKPIDRRSGQDVPCESVH